MARITFSYLYVRLPDHSSTLFLHFFDLTVLNLNAPKPSEHRLLEQATKNYQVGILDILQSASIQYLNPIRNPMLYLV